MPATAVPFLTKKESIGPSKIKIYSSSDDNLLIL
jgi:hypothetical protein